MTRILGISTVAVVLIGLFLYSQFRATPEFVSGILEGEEIRLGSRVGGRIQKLHVEEGSSVNQSQPLVEFEPFDLLELENQAASELAKADATLEKLGNGMRPEEVLQAKLRFDEAMAALSLIKEGPRKEEIAAAQSRLNAARANLKLAKREFDRLTEAYQRNAISKSEFESAEEKFASADATVRVRENELAILQAGPRTQEVEVASRKAEGLKVAWEMAEKGFREEEIKEAQAVRDAAKARLDAIREQKKELVLKSPTRGTIDALDLNPGDLVPANAPVLTLLATEKLWVRAFVPQKNLRFQVGQKLKVTFDAIPEEWFEGEVSYISQRAEFTPSNVQTPSDRAKQVFRIRVAVNDRQGVLRPGMTANVWLKPLESANE